MPDFASCCVLSFNRREFLRESLQTMVNNAGYPLELIVHDDGSDPDVTEYLYELHRHDLISTLILNPKGHNQGQGIALNRMFNMARGWPILKLDQDLIYEEGWLATVVDLHRKHSGIGLLGLFHYLHDPVDSAKCIIADHGDHEEHTHICGSGFSMPRAAWRKLGPFSEHSEAFAEDWEMQQAVTASDDFYCALPKRDLVRNIGFGVGPSTVVVDHGKVAEIHKGPKVIG